MIFPYPSDQLNKDNTTDAAAKNTLYGPYSSTPQAFFNGIHVGKSYSSWAGSLDNLVAEASSFDVVLSGNYTADEFSVNAEITKTTETTESDLTINFVVVENVTYQGQNGIKDHKNVMRKIANITGEPINIALNEPSNISTTFAFNSLWNTANLKVIVYVQSKTSMEVLQSESIAYTDFTITDINDTPPITNGYKLEQNYPNPFNPTTTISYTIPQRPAISNGIDGSLNSNLSSSGISSDLNVTMKIYDILGMEIKTLVDKQQGPGNYQIVFDAVNLSAGFYYYQLRSGNFIETKKMILLK